MAFSLDFLEIKGVIQILIYLLDKTEGVQKVDLRVELGLVSNSAVKAHKICFKLGLLENIPSINKLLFGLSEKGKKIAEKLKEIESVLNEESK